MNWKSIENIYAMEIVVISHVRLYKGGYFRTTHPSQRCPFAMGIY